jgi:hypothetical protein
MFRETLLLLLTGLAAGSVQLNAQDAALTPELPPAKPGDSAGPNRFWQATLSGGHYMVALDRISAVSRHKYLLDGAVIVDDPKKENGIIAKARQVTYYQRHGCYGAADLS